jgi:ubiquinone/menaquinone biosynthesis C-methylase UbiE
MPTDALWETYAQSGYDAVKDRSPEDAFDHFYLSLIAFGHQDMPRAAELALKASEIEPANRVFREAVVYLQRLITEGKQAVYVQAEAFGVFIRGGGNVPLYENTSNAMRAVYAEYAGATVIDIGVGDGLALTVALTDTIKDVTLVEPSAAMLAATSKVLAERGLNVDAVNTTFQDFAKTEKGNWDIAQLTYSFQSVPPKERPALMSWLKGNAKRVLIVEFDPPDFAQMYAPERVRYVHDRYVIGLAEYSGENDPVAQGFLMPVMFGYFDQTVARTNYEQPIDAWIKELKRAGFETVEKRPIYNYWWATAYLIDAK